MVDEQAPDTEPAADDAGDAQEAARDPEAQAAVDEVTSHATKLGDAATGTRTPPGIPGGADPTMSDRDAGPQGIVPDAGSGTRTPPGIPGGADPTITDRDAGPQGII
jgi:hypothetical protein